MSHLKDLLSWAATNGCVIDENVKFEYDNNKGVSAVLTKSFNNENKPLIQVPNELLITSKYAQQFFGDQVWLSIANKNALLQLFVAKLKFDSKPTIVSSAKDVISEQVNVSEKWAAYIDFLPSAGKNIGTPFFWNASEKATLKGTDAGIILERRFNAILEEWRNTIDTVLRGNSNKEYFVQLQKDFAFYRSFRSGQYNGDKLYIYLNETITSWSSFPAYLWAAGIFTARAFPNILIDPETKDVNEAFLLPIVDLLNHQNGAQVRWETEGNKVVFKTSEKIDAGAELFNNYGDKSNLELLFGYGFVLPTNEHDTTTITLKVDALQIEKAKKFGVTFPEGASADGINFVISHRSTLPDNLVKFFASLVQLKSEKNQYTLRMQLDGLAELRKIIDQKIDFLKNTLKIDSAAAAAISAAVIKTSKNYKAAQRKLIQATLEEIQKQEKSLLKKYKPISFKTVLKQDKTFMNSLLLTFGVASYDDIVKKELLDQVFLLWIVRASNASEASTTYKPPSFVVNQFADVRNTIVVTKNDVLEYADLYKTLFPSLSVKIPEIYSKGDWGVKNFIIAGTVVDRVAYKRSTNGELFILDKISLS